MVDFLSDQSFFAYVIMGFWLFSLILIFYILTFLYRKHRQSINYPRWNYIADTFIRNAIFYHSEDPRSSNSEEDAPLIVSPVTERLNKLLKIPRFRRMISRKLSLAMDNMSGSARVNLKNVFFQLRLNEHVPEMLNSKAWHIQALGIQLVGVMNMRKHTGSMLRFTSHARGLIRMEAQNTLIRLMGFQGLKFLDNAKYPISEWQQIKILEELTDTPFDDVSGFKRWLSSENHTVVILALKLVRLYYQFGFYDEAAANLTHHHPEVRRQAIMCITALQSDPTILQLIERYPLEDEKIKITILDCLSKIATEEEIPFLISLIDDAGTNLLIAVSKTLAALGEKGLRALKAHPKAQQYPLQNIIVQIESEKP